MIEYCVDLELAKELKDNGFPQESNFEWQKVTYDYILSPVGITSLDYRGKRYSAPISEEILKELPLEIYEEPLRITRHPSVDCYTVIYKWDITQVLNNNYFIDNKLSNALAKMWLYLKKKGYIK